MTETLKWLNGITARLMAVILLAVSFATSRSAGEMTLKNPFGVFRSRSRATATLGRFCCITSDLRRTRSISARSMKGWREISAEVAAQIANEKVAGGSPCVPPSNLAQVAMPRHNKRINTTFADGHAESMKNSSLGWGVAAN